jgi:hypothetical protein
MLYYKNITNGGEYLFFCKNMKKPADMSAGMRFVSEKGRHAGILKGNGSQIVFAF